MHFRARGDGIPAHRCPVEQRDGEWPGAGHARNRRMYRTLAFAAEGSRWAPWIEAVRASLRVG
jgi:hypothetical protein